MLVTLQKNDFVAHMCVYWFDFRTSSVLVFGTTPITVFRALNRSLNNLLSLKRNGYDVKYDTSMLTGLTCNKEACVKLIGRLSLSHRYLYFVF